MFNFDPKRILVATDLGPASEPALELAAGFAESLGARVILFHAILPLASVIDAPLPGSATTEQIENGRNALGEIARRSFAATDTEIVVDSGYAIERTVRTAEEKRADLVILGTHGRHPALSFLIGSVAQGVIHRLSLPAITVSERVNVSDQGIRRILCPVNYTPGSTYALRHAALLADRLGAELTALHLVESEDGENLDEEQRRLEDSIPDELCESCEVRLLAQKGNAAERVVDYATSHGVDLIVLGSSHRRFVDTTVIGTTTERVMRHASCPVMTVPSSSDESS